MSQQLSPKWFSPKDYQGPPPNKHSWASNYHQNDFHQKIINGPPPNKHQKITNIGSLGVSLLPEILPYCRGQSQRSSWSLEEGGQERWGNRGGLGSSPPNRRLEESQSQMSSWSLEEGGCASVGQERWGNRGGLASSPPNRRKEVEDLDSFEESVWRQRDRSCEHNMNIIFTGKGYIK